MLGAGTCRGRIGNRIAPTTPGGLRWPRRPRSPLPFPPTARSTRPTAWSPAVDDDVPTVTGLAPALLAALRRAVADAAGDGVRFVVTSGRRSPTHQDLLRREAVAFHRTEAVAARWVATAETSSHVSGDAVDHGARPRTPTRRTTRTQR